MNVVALIMRAVVIEDFNGSIELVRDPDTCDVLVFEDLESAWEEANRCQNGIVAMLST